MIRQAIFVSLTAALVLTQGCGEATAQVEQQLPTPPAADAGPQVIKKQQAPVDGGNPGADCPMADATSCTTQADCPPNTGGPEMFSCLPGSSGNVCTFEGQYSAMCAPLQPMVEVNAQLDPSMTSGAQSLVLRVFYPEAVDGSSTTCSSLAADQAVDGDTNLNTMVVLGVQIPEASSNIVEIPAAMIPTDGAVLYMEAWSGPLDFNTQLPTGSMVGTGCLDNQTINTGTSPLQQMAVMVGNG